MYKNSALGERAAGWDWGWDSRDPPSKIENTQGKWTVRAGMPGTRRVIGRIDHRGHDGSFVLDLKQWLNKRALGQLHSKIKSAGGANSDSPGQQAYFSPDTIWHRKTHLWIHIYAPAKAFALILRLS